MMVIPELWGAVASTPTLGNMSTSITNSFTSLAKLITAISYIGGLAFVIVAIMKFKQHKDNPTQVTIGQAISQACIAIVLLFLPSFLGYLGGTMFGNDARTSGPTGQIYCSGDMGVYSANSCGK
ncbi:type IV secretion protein IcmD [Legionella cardiaca]|uniref:Type IV secretion protein IcmD n=2 Tax=Legionella cardiaca TaxID=1071983 RepID=A0ABY8AYW7_9GAMM|nr:type IV secretion protein IcmD [Legionella cardiaca]WED44676.1 type IV secretion protein IcmD [Legionella cardiaca]